MPAKPVEFTPLEEALVQATETNADIIYITEKIRESFKDKKLKSKNATKSDEDHFLDLSDLDDESEDDIVFGFEDEDVNEDKAQQKEWLSSVMHDYLMEYRNKFGYLYYKGADRMFWMQQKRLPMKAYEFDDVAYKLYDNEEKRNSGQHPKYFPTLKVVKSLLGEEFAEKICKCHELAENDFKESVGNKILKDQMGYLTHEGRYNPVFAEDIEGVLIRRQNLYTELNNELENISPEYASIDLDGLKEQLNMIKSKDSESDDFYFGTQLMDKIDKMLENGSSAEEIKREMLIFIKQSVNHEITTLCRDNNEERIKFQSMNENELVRGVEKNLDAYPLASFDALFGVNVRMARKTLNNAINRDHHLLGNIPSSSNNSVSDDNNEINFVNVI